MKTKPRWLAAGAVVLGVLGASAAPAQSLFEQGREMLRGLTKPGGGSGASALSTGDIASGLREALRVGSARVVRTLGRPDGFNKAPDVHIPLPDTLRRVQDALRRVGMSRMADDVELRLNRAAEKAVPRASGLFVKSIQQMTINDARRILNGPKDAATQYFRGKMSKPLSGAMRPIVNQELARVGAIKSYDRMMGQYRSLPFVPNVKADLTNYVLDKAISGVFLYLGREEAAIRENPAKRTTELLRKVFGG